MVVQLIKILVVQVDFLPPAHEAVETGQVFSEPRSIPKKSENSTIVVEYNSKTVLYRTNSIWKVDTHTQSKYMILIPHHAWPQIQL